MTIDLSNQVVAVTGASSGIGEATALACAAAGAAVALAARRADRIDALAERIAGEGGRAVAVHANIFGVLYCTHAALPLMREQGSGHIVNVSSVAGRMARAGSGVYNLTKFGVGAFSESLRQEAVALGVRVTLIEPGAVATELPGHNRPEILEQMARRFQGVTPLDAQDIAGAILYAISQPPNVSVNEVLIRPSGQVA
jgi:NADP-dependent 3-hydroxy acid dehydrogenase YdfG